MIKVRYFGILRLDIKKSFDEIEAQDVEVLINIISSKYNLDIDELKNSIVFVNGKNINELKGFKTKLYDCDEVQIFSPVAGG
ncbi:MoaD family protein [Caloramator quimbayensis]|uniref:MoaD family protein n=1 Tax=Caloramator quimbayensis TaxID=1147123 RepID=A0A1T4YCG4_9CLOT|nr:MoaD/ThiS family protein [Caloramator quimbayensis]SKA99517.1 MoaD family protein [Caloramator quimbayensis]